MNKRIISVLVFLIAIITACTDSGNITSGTEGETGGTSVEVVGVIKGRTIYKDGDIASGSKVQLTSMYAVENDSSANTISEKVSSDSGDFLIPVYNTGSYGVIASDGNGNGVYKTIEINKTDSVIDLNDLVLEGYGELEVSLISDTLGSGGLSFYLHLLGFSHFNIVNEDSVFSIQNIPPGVYSVQVGPMYLGQGQTYALKDTVVEILPNEKTIVEDLRIPLREEIEITEEYVKDSLAVRAILDSNGMFEMPVKGVTNVLNGRIIHLLFMGHGVSVLPKEIEELNKLEWIWIMGHQMEELPSHIGNLENLYRLKVVSGSLKRIPEEISYLSKLRFMEINDNLFDDIPEVLTQIPTLEKIHLQSNKITNIEKLKDIKNIQSKTIDIKSNKILDISESDKEWLLENVFNDDMEAYSEFENSQSDK